MDSTLSLSLEDVTNNVVLTVSALSRQWHREPQQLGGLRQRLLGQPAELEGQCLSLLAVRSVSQPHMEPRDILQLTCWLWLLQISTWEWEEVLVTMAAAWVTCPGYPTCPTRHSSRRRAASSSRPMRRVVFTIISSQSWRPSRASSRRGAPSYTSTWTTSSQHSTSNCKFTTK